MKGILFAIMAGCLFAGYQIFIKLSAQTINGFLGAMVLQGIAFLIGILFFLTFQPARSVLNLSIPGAYFVILAGIFVGLAEIISFYAFATNISPSMGITIIVGVNILMGILVDYFFFKSDLDLVQWIGILLIFIGVLLISWKQS